MKTSTVCFCPRETGGSQGAYSLIETASGRSAMFVIRHRSKRRGIRNRSQPAGLRTKCGSSIHAGCSASRRGAGDLRYTFENGHSVAAEYLSLRGQSTTWQVHAPLFPSKQTLANAIGMSVEGHQQTHAPQQTDRYSITSSAVARRAGGTVRPRPFADLRLMTSSSLVGNSTGKSPGCEPFRILTTYAAARRKQSARLTP